jgi:hypothetical protein
MFPGGACFTAGTLVATESGYKAIEHVFVGDLVHSWNDREKKFELRPVVEAYTNSKTELYLVRGADWEVTCSAEHPFLLDGGKWRMVHEMQEGDTVQTLSGRMSKVLEIRKLTYDNWVTVYNFQVQTTHTYCVTRSGVVVHNKPP